MNLSGIMVLVPPEQTQPAITLLNALPGVQVHYQQPAAGRIVVVQEAESTAAEIDGLKRIQALPKVLSAAMVYHYFEDEDPALAGILPEPDEVEGPKNSRVPPFSRSDKK
jgi:nitrate reductase NapD